MSEKRTRKRVSTNRNPLLKAARIKGVWQPELVGVVKGYSRTQEIFDARQKRCREQVIRLNAEGRCNRRGVPDGWRGRKDEVAEIRKVARAEAKEIIRIMVEQKMFEGATVEAQEAMEIAVSIARSKAETTRDRLAALKTVLEFTHAKPASTQKVHLSTAEDFLSALALEAGLPK